MVLFSLLVVFVPTVRSAPMPCFSAPIFSSRLSSFSTPTSLSSPQPNSAPAGKHTVPVKYSFKIQPAPNPRHTSPFLSLVWSTKLVGITSLLCHGCDFRSEQPQSRDRNPRLARP